ncbi:MAG: proton-translocating transhydrogenase family protein, partial [Polyangiaceae bacterium]
MNAHFISEITVFILAIFVGFEAISKVPTTLHTPLMSATNAIHGIVLVGAILVAWLANPTLHPVLCVLVMV